MAKGRAPILYLAPWIDLGGSDKGTIDWFRHIDRDRWAPSLITTQPSPNRWLHHVEPFAEEVWELPDLMPGGEFPRFILGFIESRDIRVVHIMNSRIGFDLLPDMACLPEPPTVVVQMHAEEPNQTGYVRYVTRRYGNLIDAFSVTSEHLKETVAGYDIPPSRIEVIHSGVDCEREFNPLPVEPLSLGANGVPRVLWPGRLVEQKDPMLTLDVLARARDLGGEFLLDIVGDGHMKDRVRSRAEELDVADLIRWHPPSQEMARWYRSTDLLLMTSAFEGVPYVIYEALAMGVPVVAPALPGNREFMDESSGALIDPRDDAGQYAEALVGLLKDETRRREMGERSRRRMLEEFSLEDMGRRHDELYGRLLSARPAASRWRSDELFGEGPVEEDAREPAWKAGIKLPRNPLPKRTIGVIVPCYRHGIFLDECIRSVKEQTLAPNQIVVVDDGSDDPETIEALERLDSDPDVTVLRQQVNSGPSAARNRALAELDTSYVLPIDADDKLLPEALESMLATIEAADDDIGFVYPHAQHFGNRSDYVQLPAYNLWLLMQENYCPAPALFDRRVFSEDGVSYPEEITVGHEDWDLILQLAERGVHGLHADRPTFLYRRQGFSRVNAVDYGPHAFKEAIERRHSTLYRNADAIKAAWAPALSVVLMDEGQDAWDGTELRALSRQTCADYEVLARGALADRVREVASEQASGSAEAWLQAAIRKARGRWVCLLTPQTAGLFRDDSFVEKLLYSFVACDGSAAVALAALPGETRHLLSQIDDSERLAARPGGVAFERPPRVRLPTVGISDRDTLLIDLIVGLQANGPVQWRFVPSPGASEHDPGDRRQPSEPSLRIDLNYERGEDRPGAEMRHAACSQDPRLPELTPGTVRRWEETESWMPAGTQPLCRHMSLDGRNRVVSNDREPPPGYQREFDLGVVQAHGAPGTRRLVHANWSFELSDDQNELAENHHGLGYVEQQPLPLLEHLELRKLPQTGENVLVAGPEDPLFELTEHEETLGWIECFPLQPRGRIFYAGPRGVLLLQRYADPKTWRHRYMTNPPAERKPEVATLGSLYRHDDEGLVALRLREDGRLVTDLAQPGRASRDPRKISRWAAGPLAERQSPGQARTAVARMRYLARHFGERRRSGDEGSALGWLRREPAPGCSRLFSATHPVTGDQLVTPHLHEALNAGYLADGVLGYILNVGADPAPPPTATATRMPLGAS